MPSCRLLTLLLVLAWASPVAFAQSLKKEKFPEIGVPSFYVPRTYQAIPVQPDERWAKLYFKEKSAEARGRGAKRRRFSPELRLVVIPKRKVLTGRRDAKDQDGKPVVDIASWAEVELNGWSAKYLSPGKRDRKLTTTIYTLVPAKPTAPLRGYAYQWETTSTQFVLVGVCAEEDFEECSDLWRSVGDKMQVAEPKESRWAGEKLERFYRHKDFSHPEYRVGVRGALVDDWKAEDTENYIFVYHTDDQPLLRKLMRDIELLRLEYMKLFPPVDSDFDAVSTVRICADKDEYMAYGGSSRSAGYWNSSTEELVLFDAERHERGKRPDDSNTFIVLYHEAFHQYIHYSTGELPPHSWFNEGYGDYFSGASIKNGKVRGIGPNPWRITLIKSIVERGIPDEPVPWKDIVRFSQKEYYKDGALKYAQGWSMVYFLNTSPEVEKRPEWRKILPSYFTKLKECYAEQIALVADPEDERAVKEAGETAREAALEVAFEHVEMDEIDRAWREFVIGLEDQNADW